MRRMLLVVVSVLALLCLHEVVVDVPLQPSTVDLVVGDYYCTSEMG
jgi:hypothetical protein